MSSHPTGFRVSIITVHYRAIQKSGSPSTIGQVFAAGSLSAMTKFPFQGDPSPCQGSTRRIDQDTDHPILFINKKILGHLKTTTKWRRGPCDHFEATGKVMARLDTDLVPRDRFLAEHGFHLKFAASG